MKASSSSMDIDQGSVPIQHDCRYSTHFDCSGQTNSSAEIYEAPEFQCHLGQRYAGSCNDRQRETMALRVNARSENRALVRRADSMPDADHAIQVPRIPSGTVVDR